MGQPAAENVVAGVEGHRRLRARRWIPHRRASEVLHGKGFGGPIADRVVGENFAVRQQGDIDADDGPVDDRAPLPHGLGRARDRRTSSHRAPGGHSASASVERMLLRGGVHDRVLRCVAGRGHDPAVRPGFRRDKPGHGDRCDRCDQRNTGSEQCAASLLLAESLQGRTKRWSSSTGCRFRIAVVQHGNRSLGDVGRKGPQVPP